MNKGDLVEFVASHNKVSKGDAQKAVEGVFKGIMDALSNKNDCQFIGFGSFKVRELKSRMGKNPQTGQTIKIPSSTSVGFRPSKQMKELLNK